LNADGSRASITRSGYDEDIFYMYWSDGVGTVNMTFGFPNNYNILWTDCGSFIAGKGWNPGSAKTMSYAGNFLPEGDAWLSLYGWTKNPLVEYRIVENWWENNRPRPWFRVGYVVSDGYGYDIYRTRVFNRPSPMGTATFEQYWSVRRSQSTWGYCTGTITVKNHFNAWARRRMRLGTMGYQILATEGHNSSGHSYMILQNP
jgi:endo-1,4-beta-xylanase